jgi:hypothetical protein
MSLMELVQQSPALPIEEAPANTKLVGNIVIGRHKSGAMALEFRLPSGVPLDHKDPVHQFGIFIVQNAQQLLSIAMQEVGRAAAIQQTHEVIAAKTLEGV